MKIKTLTDAPVFGFAGFPNSGTGGTLTSTLVLSEEPSAQLQAANKGYVDRGVQQILATKLTTGTLSIERFPVFSGHVGKAGSSSNIVLKTTGVGQGEYTRVSVTAQGRVTGGGVMSTSDVPTLSWGKITSGKPSSRDGYGITDALAKAGGTVTGFVLLTQPPTQNLHVANKTYTDSRINALKKYVTGDILMRPNTMTPVGFLRANGGELSKTLYSDLFAVIGSAYNGATPLTNVNNFRLPDYTKQERNGMRYFIKH